MNKISNILYAQTLTNIDPLTLNVRILSQKKNSPNSVLIFSISVYIPPTRKLDRETLFVCTCAEGPGFGTRRFQAGTDWCSKIEGKNDG